MRRTRDPASPANRPCIEDRTVQNEDYGHHESIFGSEDIDLAQFDNDFAEPHRDVSACVFR